MSFFQDAVRTIIGGSDSKQSSSSGMDPRLMDRFLRNYDYAKRTASALPQRRIAGFTDNWREGAGLLHEAVDGPGMDAVRSATGRAGETITAPTVNAGSFLGGGVEQYMNPYTDNVVDATLSDLDRARQMALQSNADAAIEAGAFGGSRHGVVEAETNRGFADRAAAAAADIRRRAFTDATELQQRDLDRSLQAGQANQQAGLMAEGLNLEGAELQGALGGQNQQMQMQLAQALQALGMTEQELEQARLDAERETPLERVRLRNEALGISPAGGSGTTSKSSGKSTSSTGFLTAMGNFWGGMR